MSYTVAAAPVAATEKDDILRLMRANFPWGHEADQWYRWGYEQSPYRPNSCWLVETESRERVGFTSLMPRRMKVGDEICDVGQAANLHVSPQHCSGIAAIKLQRSLIAHVDQSDLAFVFGITSNAVAVLGRAGYRDLGNFSRWIKFFRTEQRLQARIPWAAARRPLAWGLDLGLRLRSAETWHRWPAGWKVEHDPPFDERFDRLWQLAAPNFTVATERTREYLQWRFAEDPQRDYGRLTVQDARGQLRGYVVFEFPDPESPALMGTIVDMLPADSPALDALMAALCHHLRKAGAVGIGMNYYGSPWVQAALRRFGFFRRTSDFHLLVHSHPRVQAQPPDLFCRDNWHLTDAEAKF